MLSGFRRRLSPPARPPRPPGSGALPSGLAVARRMGPARAEDVWKLRGKAGGGRPRGGGERPVGGGGERPEGLPGAANLSFLQLPGRVRWLRLAICVGPLATPWSLCWQFLLTCDFSLCKTFIFLLVRRVERKPLHTVVSGPLVNMQIQLKIAVVRIT